MGFTSFLGKKCYLELSLNDIIEFLDNPPIGIGDKVRIKEKNWYGANRIWIVEYVFKDGSFRLRNSKNEDELIERYVSEELIKLSTRRKCLCFL